VKRADESRQAAQQHGLQRTLLSNMIVGVDTGFTTTLQASRAVGVLPC
jgi:ribosomal protein L6P/L9E